MWWSEYTMTKTRIEFSPCRDHVSNRLIESLHLLWLEIADDRVDPSQQLVDERHHLSNLKSIVVIMIQRHRGNYDPKMWTAVVFMIPITWTWTNCLLHLRAILMKVSQAMSWGKAGLSLILMCYQHLPGLLRASRAWTRTVCWQQSSRISSELSGNVDTGRRCT